MKTRIDSLDDVISSFAGQGYICDQRTALAVYLAAQLHKPVLVEGPPGVGKTELAKAASAFLEAPLIRLQCYEGLDESRALYEWKYGKQLLYTQLLRDKLSGMLADTDSLEQSMERLGDLGDAFYSDTFLEPRPLLRALRADEPVVLLIDEIDKADQEFEAFLLELLSDYQVTIPELGTIRAATPPIVIITSNRTRELHDALKRRCLYWWIDYPDFEKEYRIITDKVPEAPARLAEQVTRFVQELRTAELYKVSGISETLDWIAALVALDRQELDRETIDETLGLVLKTREDLEAIRGERARALFERSLVPTGAAHGG